MDRRWMVIGVGVVVAALVACAVLWLKGGEGKKPAPEPGDTGAAGAPQPPAPPSAEEVAFKQCMDSEIERAAAAAREKCQRVAQQGKKGGKKKAARTVAPSATQGEVDTTPKLAGPAPADVEVRGNEIHVKTPGFSQVVFFGSHGVCMESLRVVALDNGVAKIPTDLPPECRWFQLRRENGDWATIGGGTTVKGAKVVEEIHGPFAGAHAYALP